MNRVQHGRAAIDLLVGFRESNMCLLQLDIPDQVPLTSRASSGWWFCHDRHRFCVRPSPQLAIRTRSLRKCSGSLQGSQSSDRFRRVGSRCSKSTMFTSPTFEHQLIIKHCKANLGAFHRARCTVMLDGELLQTNQPQRWQLSLNMVQSSANQLRSLAVRPSR